MEWAKSQFQIKLLFAAPSAPTHIVQFIKIGGQNRNYFFPTNDSNYGSITNTGFFYLNVVTDSIRY